MRAEYEQFKRLFQSNARRLLENEMLPAGGDLIDALSNVFALLAAFGAALSTMMVYKYCLWIPPGTGWKYEPITWPDKQFLISATMLVTAFGYVICWEGIFPDRRDSMVLCPLPLRMRTLFAAKLTSMLSLAALVVLALNAFTFLTFPFFMSVAEPPRSLVIYGLIHAGTIFASGAFTFLSLLALEGVLINVLPYRTFQRISSYVQLGILFVFLMLFLLAPYGTPALLAGPNARVLQMLPPLWFLGLYHQMLGSPYAAVHELAASARMALAASAVAAAVLYGLGYRRAVRKALEEADVMPAARRLRFRVPRRLERLLFSSALQKAVFEFVSRTMLRNRKNRLLLAAYLSVGLGYVLGDAADAVRAGGRHLSHPSAPLVALSLVLLFVALFGMRVLFTMPVDLSANWIFRLTDSGRLGDYRAAVRRVMLVFGAAPVCALTAPAYAVLWGWRPALLHLLAEVLIALIVIEIVLRDFVKIPFTCSFLPGKAQLKTRFGFYFLWFASLTFLITHVEAAALAQPRTFAALYAFGCALLALLVWRRWRFERQPHPLIYEDKPEFLLTLSLEA